MNELQEVQAMRNLRAVKEAIAAAEALIKEYQTGIEFLEKRYKALIDNMVLNRAVTIERLTYLQDSKKTLEKLLEVNTP